mgnify:CR=1 FL=1
MKKIIVFLIIVTALSCQKEELNKSIITKLYNNCVDKGYYKKIALEKIVLGEARILNPKLNLSYTHENYKKLEKLGLITIEKNNTKFLGFEQYNIFITEKGKPYLVIENKKNYVKTFHVEIKEIENIIKKEELSFAQATIILKKNNPTPFSFLTNKKDKKILLNLNKINKEWMLCK